MAYSSSLKVSEVRSWLEVVWFYCGFTCVYEVLSGVLFYAIVLAGGIVFLGGLSVCLSVRPSVQISQERLEGFSSNLCSL